MMSIGYLQAVEKSNARLQRVSCAAMAECATGQVDGSEGIRYHLCILAQQVVQ